MATQIFFNGKRETIPGVYSTIKSGIKNPALALAYGNVLVIDTGGLGHGFGGGSGINGTINSGKDSIYTFDNVRDFRSFVKGGGWWLLGGPIFLPGGGATAGASSLTYVRAATTVPATMTVLFGDFASDSTNDGQVVVRCKDEGYVGNGVMVDEVRAKATITVTNAGVEDDTISISVAGNIVGTYTVENGDAIADVVAGLVAAINDTGITSVFSNNSTQLVIYAPYGAGDDLNSLSPSVIVTGSVAGVASASFSGGVEGTILTRGYAAKLVAGINDPSKFILQFWRGTFKGSDYKISDGGSFDGVAEASTKAELVAQSPEVDTVQALVNWMEDATSTGYTFGLYFELASYVIATSDEIVAEDIIGYVKAVGGSETFGADDLSDVLESLEGSGFFDFVLADRFGDEARSTQNLSILDWITNEAKIKPDMYVGGGESIGEFAQSRQFAVAYDSQYVTLVHGGAKIIDVGGRTFKEYDSIYKAAAALGREAGLPPQIPLTFKNLGINGEVHPLKEKEIRQGLDAGLLMSRPDGNGFEVVKGINTLQNNQFLVNPDGTTHDKQIARIIRQLNKEIIINAKQQLLKKPDGANRNTVSPEDVKAWLEGYLSLKTATDTQDNIILSFDSISVAVSGDAYEITYNFVPNFPVAFLVFTGFIIDPNS